MVQSYKPEGEGQVKNKIIAKRGNTYIPLNIKNIAVFYSVDRLIFAIDFSGKKFIIDKCLTEIEEVVNTRNFFRVNRSVIVNSDAIKEFKVIEYGKIVIHLASPEWMKGDIQVSQYTAPNFREWIASL
ncbi:MAG: response regulator transcription factor [Ferruginibacter sp.]|nr:response regulator transcription factor [Ferruginibacter sp.]